MDSADDSNDDSDVASDASPVSTDVYVDGEFGAPEKESEDYVEGEFGGTPVDSDSMFEQLNSEEKNVLNSVGGGDVDA